MYGFIIYTFNFHKNEYRIKYNGNEYSLESKLNRIEEVNKDNITIDLISNEEVKQYKIQLYEDYLNQIIFDLDKTKKKKYNIDLITMDYYNNLESEILLKKGKETVTLNFPENDLRIGKIIILNTDLDFKLYIKRIIPKPIKHTSKIYISNNLYTNDNKIIGKKTKNNFEYYEKLKEIPFEIDINNIYGEELRFCLHVFEENNILTIHNMKEKTVNIDIEFVKEEELEELERNIKSKINKLIEQVKNLKLNNINFKIIEDDNYNDDIILYRIQSKEFEKKHFLAFIKYCYKYLCNFSKNIIEKMLKDYKNEFDLYLDFGKDIIIGVLSKFEYFIEYYKFIMNKNNNIKNLVIKKDNLTYQEKADILSSILTIILNSPSFSTNQNIEFFELKTNKKNVYTDALNFLIKIINNLKYDSILNKGYLKTLSRVKSDINKNNEYFYSKDNNNEVFIIELMNLDELKSKLKNYLPNMIVRYFNSKSNSAAEYDIFSGNILINELIYIGKKNDFLICDNNGISKSLEPFIKGNINLNDKNNKKKYDLFVFRAFWRLNHEGFGHQPVSKINKGKVSTPTKVIMKDGYEKTNDAGEIIEYYIYQNKDLNYFDYIKTIKFDPMLLLDENLYIENSFDKFWALLFRLEKDKIEEEDEEINEELSFFKKISNLFLSDKTDKFIINNNFNQNKIFPHPRSKI